VCITIQGFTVLIGTHKVGFKQIPLVFVTDPDTVIYHTDHHVHTFGADYFSRHRDLDHFAIKREFDCVAEEVQEYLLDSHLVKNQVDFRALWFKIDSNSLDGGLTL
jgi:hypothetical protein